MMETGMNEMDPQLGLATCARCSARAAIWETAFALRGRTGAVMVRNTCGVETWGRARSP